MDPSESYEPYPFWEQQPSHHLDKHNHPVGIRSKILSSIVQSGTNQNYPTPIFFGSIEFFNNITVAELVSTG